MKIQLVFSQAGRNVQQMPFNQQTKFCYAENADAKSEQHIQGLWSTPFCTKKSY